MNESSRIVLPAGEGELVGTSVVKAARPELSLIEFEVEPGGGVQPHFHKGHSDERARVLNLHTPGGFVEYRRELLALQARGVEPDDAFFERHDVFDA